MGRLKSPRIGQSHSILCTTIVVNRSHPGYRSVEGTRARKVHLQPMNAFWVITFRQTITDYDYLERPVGLSTHGLKRQRQKMAHMVVRPTVPGMSKRCNEYQHVALYTALGAVQIANIQNLKGAFGLLIRTRMLT